MVGGRSPMAGSMVMTRGPAVAPRQSGNITLTIGNPFRPLHSFHHHRRFGSWPYAGYYGYPYYSSPWYYGDNSYAADSYQSSPTYGYSSAYVDNSREQAEIDRLENEVDRLREERQARESHASTAAQARAKSDSQLTQLVFRDKHTEEVQNYAIVGQTLWILSAQRARKIPLAELDIPATKKANDDRGMDFQLPG